MVKKVKKKVKKLTPWDCSADINIGNFGFVYLITNKKTGKRYIGRKYFWTNRKTKIKGKKRKVRVRKESDWWNYKSSCKPLIKEIEELGQEAFTFKIISVHKTRGAVNYNEVKQMFLNDVLYAQLPDGTPAFYNNSILNRYYRGIDGS